MITLGRTVLLACLLAWTNLQYGASAGAMTEQELCALYLGVVEDAVTVFEPLWTDDSARIPNSGFFDFRKYTNWLPKWYAEVITLPGSGQVTYCYSVLLTETNKETFGEPKLTRATLLDRCIKVLRWISLTSAYVDKPYEFLPARDPHDFYQGKQWRRKLGYRADEMGWLTLTAARLWDKIDPETKALLEKVMIGGAPKERLVYRWDAGQGGNHDQVKQDLASTMGAAYLFPERSDASLYMDLIRAQGIDIVSTWHDQANPTVADGKKISEWAKGWNLYPDYSSDHHGWCQVWYGNDKLFEGRHYVEIMSWLTKKPVPETFCYPGNGFDGILEWTKTLCLPEGEPASVHGMEYDAYYGIGLLSYCYGAVLKKDPVAAALEERAAKLLRRHIGVVRQYDYHRNSFAKAATAYLIHKIAGPRAEPLPLAEAFRRLEGTYHYRWQHALVHRAPNKWASFSWGSLTSGRLSRMCGYVVPARGLAEELEPLIYLHPNSLIGGKTVTWEGKAPPNRPSEVLYKHTGDDVSFSTAGVVDEAGVDRFHAFFSFDNGPCAHVAVWRAKQACTMGFSGMPVFFYARDGLTKSRAYYDAQGTQPLEQAAQRSSPWWCVNDVLSAVAVGGNHRIKIERQVGYNWARTEAYRDKCDTIYLGGVDGRKVESGAAGVDVAVVFYPDTPHDRVAKVSEILNRPSSVLRLPDGWKGLVVPEADGSIRRHLAVANLTRQDGHTALELSFDEGAPILSRETIITGKSGLVFLSMTGLESTTETLECYAESLDGKRVRAIRQARGRYFLDPVGEGSVKVRLRCTAGPSESLTACSVDGKPVPVVPVASPEGTASCTLESDQPMCVEIRQMDGPDQTGPAVEIADVNVREDGRVQIEVTAKDRSGIRSVELYCDGKAVGTCSTPPYEWLHRPGNGAHTFYAVATDASEPPNKRTSFKRTVVVEIGKPCP